MIDWPNVLTNAIWLLGMSLSLATISYADWQAHAAQTRLRAVLERPLDTLALYTGFALVGVGAALSTDTWWERLVWALIALSAAYTSWRALVALRNA